MVFLPSRMAHSCALLGVLAVEVLLNACGGGSSGPLITKPPAAADFALSELNPTIAPGEKLQFIAVLRSNDGTHKVTDGVTWKSSDPGKVSVDSTGLVAGVAVTGSSPAVITATYTGHAPASTNVTVLPDATPVPLMDMSASQSYLGFHGGLYENSSDVPPADHDAAGKAAAAAIQPLDQNGSPSSSGAVVFLGLGMSNATLEFSGFVSEVAGNQSVNHQTLAVLDGAHGGVTACAWTVVTGPTTGTCPEFTSGVPTENQYDRVRDEVLATATTAPSAPANCGSAPSNPCLTEAQVQVIWFKDANEEPALRGFASMHAGTNCPTETGAVEACRYESQLGKVIRAAKTRYPNLKQVFLSTRIYAGYASVPINPEPYAYEYGFAAKWLIQAQVDQIRNGSVDAVAGNLDYTTGPAVWTAWGPYLWANGTIPRSDGLIWCNGQPGSPCNGEVDYKSDGTHPDTGPGVTKVDKLLMSFFLNSPYTPWFRP